MIRRVLVLGSGGREHALAWRLARDPEAPEVLVAPGSEGMARDVRRLDVGETNAVAIAARCRAEGVDLVVVGPEAPLTAGVADELACQGIATFGPTRAAARLESSKWFAKEVMAEAGVPTARAEAFDTVATARAALGRFRPPYVIKADGLAAGKGVCVTSEPEVAEAFLVDCLETGRFGSSGRRVLIEEFLEGEEASVMAVCDGARFLLLPAARDYKRAYDGDQGPNTGGMGALAPTAAVTARLEETIARTIVAPLLAAMERRGTPFRGTLYCGLMMGPGGPRVVEFNARFGDPEAQVVLPLVEGSLVRLLDSAARGALDPDAVSRGSGAAVAVALTDEGYPDAVRGRGRITGLEEAARDPGVAVFYAACAPEADGGWRVSGGRAAYVVGFDPTTGGARDRAYGAIARLGGAGWRCRRDIAAAHETARSRADSGAGSGSGSWAAAGSAQ